MNLHSNRQPSDSAPDWDLIVVGAGAAGLMAAARAAERGRRVLLLEKNRKPGVKILMSGGTRCNLTQATDARGIVKAFGKPGRFLHSSLAALGPDDLVEWFRREGVPTKREATGKVFPVSNRAVDVLNALRNRVQQSGAQLVLERPVVSVEKVGARFHVRDANESHWTQKLMLTTGGQSYPGSGSTGDGYVWAKQLGHRIVPPRPALTPLKIAEDWVADLRGVTLPHVGMKLGEVGATFTRKSKPLAEESGSFLFAHFGVSGPAALNISRHVSARVGQALMIQLDFTPERSEDDLLALWNRRGGNASVLQRTAEHAPRRLLEQLWRRADVPRDRNVSELNRRERSALTVALKQTQLPISGVMGFAKAEVTAGGVALDEVDSRTMQSKLCPGLFLAGEILDLDGPIGGYNFQAAFSTAWLGAQHV